MKINIRYPDSVSLKLLCLLFLCSLCSSFHLMTGFISDLKAEQIKIGVSTVLTGEAATWGTDIKNGISFANEALAKGSYELIFEDDKCNGKDAVSVAKKLISIDQVKYVLGFACSSATLSAAPVYEKAKVPIISSSASAAEISQAGDYVFRTWPSDAAAGELLASHISKTKKVVGIISEQSDYTFSLREILERSFQKQSVRVENVEFLSKDTDYRTLLLKLKSKNIDALVINSQFETSFNSVLKQVKDLKLDWNIYGAYWPGTNKFLEISGDLANGIEYVDSVALDSVLTNEGKRLMEDFEKQFGPPVSFAMVVATSIEAFRALDLAIKKGGDVQHNLMTTKYDGIFGPWHFDQNGDIEGLDFGIFRIENQKPVKLPVRIK